MNSNKSISWIFISKIHFLPFQKWPKINLWTRKKFQTARNAILWKNICFIWFHEFFAWTFLNFLPRYFFYALPIFWAFEHFGLIDPASYLLKIQIPFKKFSPLWLNKKNVELILYNTKIATFFPRWLFECDETWTHGYGTRWATCSACPAAIFGPRKQ